MVGTDGWSTLIVLAGLMLSVLAGWGLVELVFQLAEVAAQVGYAQNSAVMMR